MSDTFYNDHDLDLDLFLDPENEKLFSSEPDTDFLSDETIFSSKSLLFSKEQSETKLDISVILDPKFDPACLEHEFELFVKSKDKEALENTGCIYDFDIFEQNKLLDDTKKENFRTDSRGSSSSNSSSGSGGSSGGGSSGGSSSGGSSSGSSRNISGGSIKIDGINKGSSSTVSTIKLDLLDDKKIKRKLSITQERRTAKQQYNKEKRKLEKELEKYNIYIKTENAQIKHYNTWVRHYFDKLQLRKNPLLHNLITLSSKQIKIDDDAEKIEINQLNYYTNMRDKHIKMQNDYILICSKIKQQLKELIDLHELKELHNISCSATINETPCPKRVCI
jgi:hypothetical protein